MFYIITGSTSGLGFYLTSCLLSKSHVIGISRSINPPTALQNHTRYHHLSFDLSTSEYSLYRDLIQSIFNLVDGQPYTLIFNAALFYSSDIRLSSSDLFSLYRTNFFSTVQLISLLELPTLSRIVIINSISGLVGQCDQPEYSSSKHALMGYTRSLIKRAKHRNYDVMCFNPGGINTPLWDSYPEINRDLFLSPHLLSSILVPIITASGRVFIENMTILPECDI